jgi:hypothetical protein
MHLSVPPVMIPIPFDPHHKHPSTPTPLPNPYAAACMIPTPPHLAAESARYIAHVPHS